MLVVKSPDIEESLREGEGHVGELAGWLLGRGNHLVDELDLILDREDLGEEVSIVLERVDLLEVDNPQVPQLSRPPVSDW